MAQQDNNVVSFSKKSPADAATQREIARNIYTKCEELAVKLLEAVCLRMFDNADDTLFKFAEQSDKQNEPGGYFDSLRLIRLQREATAENYIEYIKKRFAQGLAGKSSVTTPSTKLSIDELSLVEDSDLEETIAVKNMVAKIRYQYPEELHALQTRLEHLLPDAKLTEDTNPLGPESLCQSFLTATKSLDVDIKIRLIILKLFEHHVITGLKPLYDTINKLMIDANVLPVIKPSIIKSAEQQGFRIPTPTTTAANNQTGIPPVGDANTMTTTGNDMSLPYLQSLMSQYRQTNTTAGSIDLSFGGGGVAASGIAMTPDMLSRATNTLTTALTTMQLNPVALPLQGDVTGSTDLRQVVFTQLAQQGVDIKSLNPVDNDIIDIVSMLFEYILDDEQIPDVAKALLGKLQIPLLKAAILDKEFFATKGHPARALLNDMARASMMVTYKEAEHANSFYGEIKRIVDIIITDFKDDLGLFTKLQTEFQNFMELFRYHESMAEENVAKVIRQKEDIELATRWVDESLREVLQSRQLPSPIEAIITGAWRQVMLKTYLNGGQDNDTWKNQIRFIEILDWSIQPKRISMDRAKLAGIIYQLVSALRHGLLSIGMSTEDIARVLSQLEPYHVASIKGLSHSGVSTSTALPVTNFSADDITGAIKVIEAEIAALTEMQEATFLGSDMVDQELMEDITLTEIDTSLPQPDDQPQDEYLDLARRLEQGKWIEFAGKRNQRIRAKLAYKSELLGEYTFLDWKHKVVADKTLYGLAADLRRGTATILDDAPLFDRAITAISRKLGGKR